MSSPANSEDAPTVFEIFQEIFAEAGDDIRSAKDALAFASPDERSAKSSGVRDAVRRQSAVSAMQRRLVQYQHSDMYGIPTLDAIAMAVSYQVETALKALIDPKQFPEYMKLQDQWDDLDNVGSFFAKRLVHIYVLDFTEQIEEEGRAQSEGDLALIRDLDRVAEALYPRTKLVETVSERFTNFEESLSVGDDDLGMAWSSGFLDAVDSLAQVDREALGNRLERALVVPGVLAVRELGNTIDVFLDKFASPTKLDEQGFDKEHIALIERVLAGGIWLPPLSASQIQEAIAFGVEQYGTAAQMQSASSIAFYDLRLDEPGVLITIRTTFGRIAAYAGQVARTGMEISPTTIEEINTNASLRRCFSVRLISKHKKLSLLTRTGSKLGEMLEATVTQENGYYIQSCWFPYPQSLSGVQDFELGIPRFLGFKNYRFSFDFSGVH
jgi:hypothetical protein